MDNSEGFERQRGPITCYMPSCTDLDAIPNLTQISGVEKPNSSVEPGELTREQILNRIKLDGEIFRNKSN